MKTIIEWLSTLEKLSAVFYKKLSRITANDRLKRFLLELSADEMDHHCYMKRGLELLEENDIDEETGIIIDDRIRERIESLVVFADKKMENASEEDIYDRIITIEFSEWNEIFLYATGYLKKLSVEYQAAASEIQKHLDRIKNFFNSDEIDAVYYERIKGFESVWETRLLIVDDTESILSFLNLYCRKFGIVDIAYDGNDAVEKAVGRYYDLIISDVEMPELNGIEMYKKLSENDAGLNKKFIFMSGNAPPLFIMENGIAFIKKPFTISELEEKIKAVLPVNPG